MFNGDCWQHNTIAAKRLINSIARTAGSTDPTPEDVVWTQIVGCTATGNDLTKTAATGWLNAGAVSTKSIQSGDGYVEFVASETNTGRMLGLSKGSADASYAEIDFAVYLKDNGDLQVYENASRHWSGGTYITGDVIRVAVIGGVVKYSQNGIVRYTSAIAPAYPLLVDTALYTIGATLNDVVLCAADLGASGY
jgi:hypothetical protein